MSEAEQYQKLRKYWKDKYRKAQREQSISMWEAKYAIPHPSKVKFMKSLGYHGIFGVSSPTNCVRNALRYQQEASDYANMLNTWKVKEDKNTIPEMEKLIVYPGVWESVGPSAREIFSLFGIFRILLWDSNPSLPNILRFSIGRLTFDIMRNKNDLLR